MAFNADEYIDVIVEQLAGNFQELESAVLKCDKFQEVKTNYIKISETSDDVDAFVKVHDEFRALEQDVGTLICDKYRTIEPLSVGLFGEWGSGKTHLLKLVKSKVNEQQLIDFKKDKEKRTFPQITIPIFFNAWRFEKEEHLIIPLFQTMLAEMEAYEQMPFSEEVKKALRHGFKKFTILAKALKKGLKVPDDVRGAALKLVEGDVSVVADVVDGDALMKEYKEREKEAFRYEELLKELTTTGRLEAIYYQIPQWIEKIAIFDNISFVFLIDDLDRCLPENTLKMLESIKLFLDVPSCAFVLAIDDDVVERGVAYHYRDYLKDIVRVDGEKDKQVQELPITGHEYLEKMIQLLFRIPVIDGANVRQFLVDNYADLLVSKKVKTSVLKTDRFISL
ncbi:MAG: KAP family NTPase [Epsilonproteobacteria bacterium]|nr:KAP family NTPase [Campylobacterota bacterium]